MTMINTAATPRLSAPFAVPALARLVARFNAARVARIERAETYRALSVLTERELDDIGLTRADVNALR